jgi:putative transposase
MVVNKKLILSIMRELGLKGLPGPKKHKKNLVNQATEEDLVQRNFTVDAPNVLWLTDITEHPTRKGKVYCCVVLDTFSRKVVGWAIDRRCQTALVNDAVMMASGARPIGPGAVIHSDHGSQTSSPREASANS